MSCSNPPRGYLTLWERALAESLTESRSTQSIPNIRSQVEKGNGNYGRDPVKGFIIVPCSSAAGVDIKNEWNEWSYDQEDMGLDLQDIRKNIALQD
jgi:hypothetical protein